MNISRLNISERVFHDYGIWVIMLVALILRVFNINEMALANDELSALARCRYDSLYEVIQLGVVQNDMHPPLVQVFVYYYTKLFGNEVLVYKLPFIVCGLLSVVIAFRLFKKMFNAETALLVAAFMASTQYFITHGQTARMYAPALLFTLLFIEQLFDSRTIKSKWIYIKACILLLVVANTHYMALITCAFAGLLFVSIYKTNSKRWLITFGISAVLFLMEMPILFPQFKHGGLTWIPVPDFDYLFHYLRYVVQYSTVLIIVAFSSIVYVTYLIFHKTGLNKTNHHSLIYCGLLFILSFGFAYIYSKVHVPIIQYSILLFSAPFMLAFVSYPISLIKKIKAVTLISALLIFNIYNLIAERNHYQVYYHQSYKASAEVIVKHAGLNTPLFLNANDEYYYQYYFKRNGFKANIVNGRIDSLNYYQFEELIKNATSDTIIIAHGFSLPYEYLSIARKYYSDSVYFNQDVLSETYVLRKKRPDDLPMLTDTFLMDKEYGEPVTLDFKAEYPVINIEVETEISAKMNDSINPGLVLILTDKSGKQVLWREAKYQQFKTESAKPADLFVHIRAEVKKGNEYKVNAFVWNSGRQNFTAATPKIKISKGNLNMYGMLAPIHKD